MTSSEGGSCGRIAKRALDLLLACIGLAVLAIPFAVVGLLIRLDSRGPACFRQVRVGQHGRRFRAWKFRTMVVGAEVSRRGAYTTADDPRVTRIGRALRRCGIDELPQLINVVLGQMSLVGPRPTLQYQVDKYTPGQRRRLSVKPGLTGWALVNGRNSLTWPEKIEFDLWYVDHWAFGLDLKILWLTPWVVLSGRGLFIDKMDGLLARDDGDAEGGSP